MHTPVSHEPPTPMRREGCTSENWTEGPWNRWGFSHVRELARTACISRGQGPVWALPERHRDFAELRVDHSSGAFTLHGALAAAYADGMVVLHRGELVHEWYAPGIDPHRTHLLMSVSKSLTSGLVAALVGEGLIDPAGTVEQHVPALAGTAWEGATVQHLLDMAAGVRFDEDDYNDLESDGVRLEQVSGYTTRTRDDYPTDTASWILDLAPQGEHGDRFQYRSIITDVLGWICEQVTGMRFADLFSDRIWSRIGPEHDADIIVDAKGFPTVEGGICTTTRDLARFGQLYLQNGVVRGAQVVPAEWTTRMLDDDGTRRRHFDAARDGNPHEFYKDCWWVYDAARGLYAGHGINGQQLYVDRATHSVIAIHSTWPCRLDLPLVELCGATAMAVLDALA